MYFTIFIICNLLCIYYTSASVGDNSPFYNKCVSSCTLNNCTNDGANFLSTYNQPIYENILFWSCEDDCRYNCMWDTVKAFEKRNWNVPQFHGKWPFVKWLGMQEPASVLFSLLNLYVHVKMLKKLRNDIHWQTPLYWLWHMFSIISLNGWFWSTVFHARDKPFTELMDYTCAFSIVYIMFYCMIIRVLRGISKLILILLTTILIAFFANHVVYLYMGRFDYAYNMQLNILIGTITAMGWFTWCTWNRLRQPYVWKCAVYVAFTGMALLLEIIDKPPFLWVFDSHSLWHLSSVPLTMLFYSFIFDDCKYLRRKQYETENEKFFKIS